MRSPWSRTNVRGVGAADQQVPGVQAPAGVGHRERALDVRGRLDLRADVRVQREREPVLGDPALELVEMAPEALPRVLVHLGARRPREVADRRRHEDLGARRGEHVRDLVGRRRVELGSCSTTGTNPPTSEQPVAVEPLADLLGVERQVADRPELGGAQAERRHLAEHALGVELATPAGDLADAP